MKTIYLYFPDTTYYAIVEYAHEWPDMRQGLMYREQLDEHAGMLFDFGDSNERRSMWNHNVPIYLDMLFANLIDNGENEDYELQIVDLAENVPPYSKGSVISRVPCRFVIELPGSTVENYDIRIGDTIEF